MYKFVINLKRRPDRLELFKNECPYTLGPQTKTNFLGKLLTDKPCFNKINVIYGFDSKFPDEETPEEQFLYKNVIKLNRPGETGCFISHLRIFTMVVQNNYHGVVVFEDDARFSPVFDKKLQRVIKDAPKDYHIIYIGGRFSQDYRMKSESVIPINGHINRHNVANWYNHDHDRTTHGYIISNRGAKFLLEQFNNSTRFEQIDHWMMNTFVNNNVKVYSSVPLLCWSPLVGDSDIR